MGFLVYSIWPKEDGFVKLQRVAPLVLGGLGGLFAKHLPTMSVEKPEWSFTARELCSLSGLPADASQRVFFELSPPSSERFDLYELIGVKGRTVSLITDALFHFKVACSGLKATYENGREKEILIPNWQHRPIRFEQIRLDGGVKGGTWAWNEPPQSMSATIL